MCFILFIEQVLQIWANCSKLKFDLTFKLGWPIDLKCWSSCLYHTLDYIQVYFHQAWVQLEQVEIWLEVEDSFCGVTWLPKSLHDPSTCLGLDKIMNVRNVNANRILCQWCCLHLNGMMLCSLMLFMNMIHRPPSLAFKRN